MARKRRHAASRESRERRLAGGLAVAIFGMGGGVLLGLIVIGSGLDRPGSGSHSFADLSANPDARIAEAGPVPPCPDCTDSYGSVARLRAERASRLSDPFRSLGQVDADAPLPPDDETDHYRYGGRFPDAPGSAPRPVLLVPAAITPPDASGAEPTAKTEARTKGPDAVPEPLIVRD